MDIKKALGSRIKSVRKSLGMTQEQLAEKANISVTFIGLTERGVNIPSVKTCESIAKAMGVTLSELFAVDETNEKEKVITELNSYLRRSDPEDVIFVKEIAEKMIAYKKR